MILLALSLVPVAYGFSPGVNLDYDVNVRFEGFIPVLGGQEGKVEVDMGVRVEGLEKKDANLRSSSDIKRFKISFNGAELPLTLDSIKDYFPKNTIELSPAGQIVKTDAPELKLPVRLPGLDAKRFPDITYLPIQFPDSEMEIGKTWEFKKNFDGSDITYTCKATKVDPDWVEVDMTMAQSYTILENESKEVVTDKKDAIASVATTLKGSGRVIFDRKRGVVTAFSASADADSRATDLKTKLETRRMLKTILEVKLKEPKKTVAKKPESLVEAAQGWWETTKTTTLSMWSKAKGYWFTAKTALSSALSGLGIHWPIP